MENLEIEKAKVFTIKELIKYGSHSIVIKSIIKKITGNVTVISCDSGEPIANKASPFDTLIQMIDGRVEIIFKDESHFLEAGQGIIIPAHVPNKIKSQERFKMIATIIKSGYEDVA